MRSPVTLRRTAVSLVDAVASAPVLAALSSQVRQSETYFSAVKTLLPATLIAHVAPGPVDSTAWCLFVKNSSAASKLRQLTPALEQQLVRCGHGSVKVRIKILAA